MIKLYKSLSLLLTLFLAAAAFAGLTLQAAAADVTIDLSTNPTNLNQPAGCTVNSIAGGGYKIQIDSATSVEIKNEATVNNYTIVCNPDVKKITLTNAKWTAPYNYPALEIAGSATINVNGNNALTGGIDGGDVGNGGSGIYAGDSVTIGGSGTVEATGGYGGGSGGNGIYAVDSIEIKGSGSVTANGGGGGAGSGSGGHGIYADNGNIEIKGTGTVEATGGSGGLGGNGSGIAAESGSVTISGSGSVKATGGNGGDSGRGGNGITAGGDITISEDVNVTTTGGNSTYGSGGSTGGGPTGGHGAWINGNLNVNITSGTVTFTGGTGSAIRGHGVVDLYSHAWTTEEKISHPGVNMSPIAGNKGDAKPGELNFWVDGAESTPDDPKPITTTARRRAATELSLSLKRNFDETTLTPKIRYDFTIVGPENGDTANVYVKGGTLASRSGLNFTVIPDAEAEVVEITVSANGYKQLTIEYDIAAAPQNSEPMPDDDGDNFNPGTGV